MKNMYSQNKNRMYQLEVNYRVTNIKKNLPFQHAKKFLKNTNSSVFMKKSKKVLKQNRLFTVQFPLKYIHNITNGKHIRFF